MNIQNSNFNVNGVSFSGHEKSLDKEGKIQHKFYYLYDTQKYDCEVEFYNIKSVNGDIEIMDKNGPAGKEPLSNDGVIEIPKGVKTNSKEGLGFAYRFKLTEIERDRNGVPLIDEKTGRHIPKLDEKGNPIISFAFDNGDVIGIRDENRTDNKYNIVLANRAIINKNGPMQLIMPDEYYPGVIKNRQGEPTIGDALRAKTLSEVKTTQELADYKRKKALSAVRTHANKLGGNFYGIIARLPEIKNEGISRIVGTPFTKDTVSSHLYWTENAYQIAPELGTEKDFKELQKELFKNGINWIADAALVNEGLGGAHLGSVLRNGQGAFDSNMFRINGKIKLGILPAETKSIKKHTKMKIINSPWIVEQNKWGITYLSTNKKFDKTKATYIQFYDDRLASDEQINSESPLAMKTYAKKNTKNIYDITRHYDAIYPFAIEVDPSDVKKALRRTMFRNGGELDDIKHIDYKDIKTFTDFKNFQVVEKTSADGIELWDGNVDIAKLNFFVTDKDLDFKNLTAEQSENFKRGALVVKDYAINSGRYWTQLTTDTQLEYITDELSKCSENAENYKSSIDALAANGLFPESVKNIDEDTIVNVMDGSYHLRKLEEADKRSSLNPETKTKNPNEYTLRDYILKKAVDTPLETLPVSNNLMSILTSPYITQRPVDEKELGVSKYDLIKIRKEKPDAKYNQTTSQMTDIYKDEIAPMIKEVVKDITYTDAEGRTKGITDKDGNISEYGRYVLSEITPDLTKYIITKSLVLSVDREDKNTYDKIFNMKKIVSKDGHFDFSKVDDESITMQSLGIPYTGKETKEAQIVIDSLKTGLLKFKKTNDLEQLKGYVQERFKDRRLNDYKIAEMLHDRTESGLGWRIDAAKDVASVDNFRSGHDSIEDIWDNVIDFWKVFNQTVLKENPHAYTTAEITDLDTFITDFNPNRKYKCDADAERKFIEQTGITSVANYTYFFSLMPALYYPFKFDDGDTNETDWISKEENLWELRKKLAIGWDDGKNNNKNPGFLFQSPEDGVANSYTFIGNHDKPRALHCLSMDMNLFHGGLKTPEHRKIAEEVTMLQNPDYDKLDSKAIAMGQRINFAIDDVIPKDTKLNKKLKEAVSDLAQGKFKGKHFPAEAFGTRPLEIAIKSVFDQMEYKANIKTIQNRDEFEAKMLKSILEPACEKFLYMYKMLVTLPGSPTDFAGDRTGVSGYESKAKNYHQQNRNVIPWEYLKPENEKKYKFIQDFYKEMNKISNLRKQEELSALNNGAAVSLPINIDKTHIQGLLRYNAEGSVVISLFTNKGANSSGKTNAQEINMQDLEKFNRNPVNENKENTETSTKNELYNRIILNPDMASIKEGLKHGIDLNSVFRNARNLEDKENPVDTSIYKFVKISEAELNADNEDANANTVSDGKEYYCLKRFNADTMEEEPITITPEDLNALILYKEK